MKNKDKILKTWPKMDTCQVKYSIYNFKMLFNMLTKL